MTRRTGRCLCGAVTFTAEISDDEFAACHCAMCRKWSSSPFFAVMAPAVETRGEVTAYRSSPWAERCFCSQCGTALFYRVVDTGESHISLGALDDAAEMRFSTEIFTDEKPASYAFEGAADRTMMTGPEVFAMFAPPPTTGA